MQNSIKEDQEAASNADISNATLSSEHQDYLLSRHGTLELIPMPSMHPVDPLNWPSWKVSSPADIAEVELTGVEKR